MFFLPPRVGGFFYKKITQSISKWKIIIKHSAYHFNSVSLNLISYNKKRTLGSSVSRHNIGETISGREHFNSQFVSLLLIFSCVIYFEKAVYTYINRQRKAKDFGNKRL